VISGDARVIPLADVPLLRAATRRTAALRVALAAALVALALTAVASTTRLESAEPALLPAGSDGIVVLDVSASVSSDTYARIAAALDRLARSDGRYGLVLFSDVAYELLPPGTPARELRPFERYFVLQRQRGPGFLPEPPISPWGDAFSGGTRISTGLQVAFDRIRAERLARPAVLLVSDLDDDQGDLESLTSVALAMKRSGVTVRVVGLNPAPEDAQFVERLLPRGARDLTPGRLPGEDAAPARGALPAWLVGAGLALAVLLALNELVGTRLRWRTAE
jgi:VWA domain containing CoxE-like protein